jgi:hypothetical protein
MLEKSGYAENAFKAEGHEFWGDIPPFTPVRYPTGTIYQRYHGLKGHCIDETEITERTVRVLQRRLKKACRNTFSDIVMNKNPYNSVRLRWIRELFPEAVIVCLIRKPLPNVFSLLKKYGNRKSHNGLLPEEGWWGVKPAHWKELLNDDKIVQCAEQWSAVNQIIDHDKGCIDIVVPYHELCASPSRYMKKILSLCGKNDDIVLPEFGELRCLDDDYCRGSSIVSKNRLFRKTGSFAVPDKEEIELAPFTEEQIDRVFRITKEVSNMFSGFIE